MLGEQVGEVSGQMIGTRILDDTGFGPRTEMTDHQVGTICDVQVEATVTFTSTMRPNGTLVGEGTGFVVTAHGQTATFRGQGVGTFTGPGTVAWRGSEVFETTGDELSALNGIAVIFEYTVVGGKSEGKLFEWK
ncbi:hypothetical protein ACL02S_13885 [Nocardia sp. 004]|uniref:hypothetical protein n=1 Tax=Nocardia sp. 004 TaxID=3385978 RepID=UPI0039A020CE